MSAALEGNKGGNYQGTVSVAPSAVTIIPVFSYHPPTSSQTLPKLWLTTHPSQEITMYVQRSRCLLSHQVQAYFENMV